MKKTLLFFLLGSLLAMTATSCDDDFLGDPLEHIDKVKAEAFTFQELYDINHCTEWAQIGSYLEHAGYINDGRGGLNRNWNKMTDYGTLRYVKVDSLLVSYNVNCAPWASFGGHTYQTIYCVNDKIAESLINQRMEEFEQMITPDMIKQIKMKVGVSNSTYYSWDVAKEQFLTSWDPGEEYRGYTCSMSVYTDDMIYLFVTYCKGDYPIGRGFNIRFGTGNRNEM